MSAIQTAQAVIEWALTRPLSPAAPPAGDLRLTEQLARPPADLCEALGQLGALTGARLRFSTPPLGDGGPVGAGALLIAAAIGSSKTPEVSRLLLQAVPPPASPADWVARHGLVGPALQFLPEPVGDDCRLASPLSSLLERPLPSQMGAMLEITSRLIAHPAERLALTLHLARPTADAKVRLWRHTLLDRLRLAVPGPRDFVLDVYEAMMIHYERETLAQVRAARERVINSPAAGDEPGLRDALSVANLWQPLWALERSDIELLRARRHLGYAYREGIALFRMCRRLVGDLTLAGGTA